MPYKSVGITLTQQPHKFYENFSDYSLIHLPLIHDNFLEGSEGNYNPCYGYKESPVNWHVRKAPSSKQNSSDCFNCKSLR